MCTVSCTCVYYVITTLYLSKSHTAGTDFSQIGSLVKDRHLMQRQMSSSGVAANNPFVPATRTSSSRKSVPIPGMSNRIQRERGTKVILNQSTNCFVNTA